MTIRTFLVAPLCALVLAACQPTTTATGAIPTVSSNSDTRTLQANLNSFAQNLALAGFMAEQCRSFGIRQAVSDRAATVSFFNAMGRQGYSADQLEAAADQLASPGQVRRTSQQLIAYLQSRGVQPGDTDRLCAVAIDEINRGTQAGQFLRRV